MSSDQTNGGTDLLAKAMRRVFEEQVQPADAKPAPEKTAAPKRQTEERR